MPECFLQEIRNVIRQITACVTFLPLLDTPCKYLRNNTDSIYNVSPIINCFFLGSFDLQIHTTKDAGGEGWSDVQPLQIHNAQEVSMRSFSTSIQSVHTFVSYKST